MGEAKSCSDMRLRHHHTPENMLELLLQVNTAASGQQLDELGDAVQDALRQPPDHQPAGMD